MSYFIPSLILSLGIVSSSYILRNSIENYRNFGRFVEVKGLDEKIVKANVANWELNFTVVGDDLKKLYPQISFAQNKIIEFLKENGFTEEEIEKQSISINDAKANAYSTERPSARFTANSGINLKTNKVDKVNTVVQKTGAVIESGIVLNTNHVKYLFTDLNTIKPDMLARATENAREAANTFAKNSNSHVGSIKKATQGLFTISPASSENNEYDNGSILKKVRVVTTVEFFIN